MDLSASLREVVGLVEYVLADAGSLENARIADQENKERHRIQDLLGTTSSGHSNLPAPRG